MLNRAIAAYYDWRARCVWETAIRKYHHDHDLERATRRLLRAEKRRAVLKKTSEKFFSRVKGRV